MTKLTAAQVLQEVLKVEAMTDEHLAQAPAYGVYRHATHPLRYET